LSAFWRLNVYFKCFLELESFSFGRRIDLDFWCFFFWFNSYFILIPFIHRMFVLNFVCILKIEYLLEILFDAWKFSIRTKNWFWFLMLFSDWTVILFWFLLYIENLLILFCLHFEDWIFIFNSVWRLKVFYLNEELVWTFNAFFWFNSYFILIFFVHWIFVLNFVCFLQTEGLFSMLFDAWKFFIRTKNWFWFLMLFSDWTVILFWFLLYIENLLILFLILWRLNSYFQYCLMIESFSFERRIGLDF
jgi:hypothetical protein